MNKLRLLIFVGLLFTFSLSSCNFPGSGGDRPSDPASMPTSAEPTDPPRTAEPLEAGSDPCLQGNWIMPNEDVNSFMLEMLHLPNMSFPNGSLIMSFTGDTFAYASDGMKIRLDMGPNRYMESEFIVFVTGNYSTKNGIITYSNITTSQEILVWRAVDNGEVVGVPGSGPTVQYPPPSGGPYGCTTDTLTLQVPGSSGPVVAIFRRQP